MTNIMSDKFNIFVPVVNKHELMSGRKKKSIFNFV